MHIVPLGADCILALLISKCPVLSKFKQLPLPFDRLGTNLEGVFNVLNDLLNSENFNVINFLIHRRLRNHYNLEIGHEQLSSWDHTRRTKQISNYTFMFNYLKELIKDKQCVFIFFYKKSHIITKKHLDNDIVTLYKIYNVLPNQHKILYIVSDCQHVDELDKDKYPFYIYNLKIKSFKGSELLLYDTKILNIFRQLKIIN